MKIAVYCSANENIDPDFFQLSADFGKWMGANGHTLVYGGCNIGLMECIGTAVRNAGGSTIGVVPRIIEEGGKKSDSIDIEIPCDCLTDRKDIMMLRSDVYVALPGGIGTLDELFTVAASATIGYHKKKVILYNMKGFWNQLVNLLEDLQERGFIRGNYQNYIQIANNQQELVELIEKAQ